MYKQFQTKFLALLALLLMGAGSAWADEVTFTAGTDTGNTSVTKDGITVSMSTMSRTDNYRCYANTKMTVSSNNATITKIEVTCTASGTSDYGPGKFSGTGYTYSGTVGTWTGSASSVTLSASSQVRMTKIIVTYTSGSSSSVTAPVFSPAAGEVAYGTQVTITQENDYLITYTTDGTEPTYYSPTFNSNKPIVITGETTVKAIAFGNNDQNNPSSVATATYTVIHPNAPVFSPAAGGVAAGTQITITAEQGYRIMYTTNGTDPSYQSNIGEIYDAPITINEAMTIKAIAVNIVDPSKNIGLESPVAEATYTIRQAISGYNVDFESELDLYTDWNFTNAARLGTGIAAHGGDYFATTGGKSTASFQTKEKIEYPRTFTCYVSKQSNNTTASTWKIQVSTDGESWTDVASQDATSMTQGTWVEFSASLLSYTNVYVRLYYTGSTAVRDVDDISLSTYVPVAYTVTLADDNSTLTEEAFGAGVTLPTRVALGNYTFAGWSDTNVANETTTAPTIVAAGTYHPTADVTLYPVYTRSEGSSTTTTKSVTISDYATANEWVNGTQYNTVVIDNNVTATASDGSNTGKYYTNGNDWRFYQNEDAMVTIALTPNGTLNSVKFTFSNSNSGTLNYNNSAVTSGIAVNVSGTSAEFTVGNSGTATNGQVRITAIEVNYTIGTGTTYYWSNPGATVSISSVGLATFCSEYALDFSGVTDVWAYIAKYENDKVTYQRVKKVPANTGVLLRNKLEEAAISCVVPFLAINADDVTGNMFIGTLTDINALASVDGQNTNYILNNGANGVGFYKANNKKVGAGKAYLQLPTNAAKTFIGFEEEGEATSISTIDNGQLTMENAYNLQGQKVGSEYKGIVIVNGKKVMVK